MLIVIVVVLAILAVIAVIADNAVRSYAEDRVRTELRTALSLPADAPLDVRIGGFSMLLQLIGGSIGTRRRCVRVGHLRRADRTGHRGRHRRAARHDAAGPRPSGCASAASEESLTSLSANLSGLPITSVQIEGDQIDVAGELTALFITVPLGVGLSAAADDGEIAFTPESISVADADFSVADLKDRFGALADRALQTRNFCIAQFLPAPLVLQDVRLDDPRMVLTFDARDVVLDEATLGTMGTCP